MAEYNTRVIICNHPELTGWLDEYHKDDDPVERVFYLFPQFIAQTVENGISPVQSGNKVWFHKSTVFPRTKLTGASVTRTIKRDKADVLILPDKFLEFVVRTLSPVKILVSATADGTLIYKLASYDSNMGEAYSCFRFYTWQNGDWKNDWRIKLLEELCGDPSIKYNFPAALNPFLKLATIDTRDEIESLLAMIRSSDANTQKLGMSTMLQYDLNATPTIANMLYHTYRARERVNVLQLVECKAYRQSGILDDRYGNLLADIKTTKEYELMKPEYTEYLYDKCENFLDSLPANIEVPEFKLVNTLASDEDPDKILTITPVKVKDKDLNIEKYKVKQREELSNYNRLYGNQMC